MLCSAHASEIRIIYLQCAENKLSLLLFLIAVQACIFILSATYLLLASVMTPGTHYDTHSDITRTPETHDDVWMSHTVCPFNHVLFLVCMQCSIAMSLYTIGLSNGYHKSL